jgi:predicted ATPase
MGVSDAGRQLLQTAVVIGRSFDLDTLRAASAAVKRKQSLLWKN